MTKIERDQIVKKCRLLLDAYGDGTIDLGYEKVYEYIVQEEVLK